MPRYREKGIDESLLFFFLLLVLMFCKPRAFGCDDECCDICDSTPCC